MGSFSGRLVKDYFQGRNEAKIFKDALEYGPAE